MSNVNRVLLVEGESDKSFFEEVCKQLSLSTKIQVAPPRDLGGTHNSKQGIFKHLSTLLLKQLADGQLTHLAIIMDADYKDTHGLGYKGTLAQFERALSPFGFSLKKNGNPNVSGLFFESSDGLNDIGVWIMPDTRQEGMLEDWLKQCVSNDELTLFRHATQIAKALPQQKFKEIHRSKAEIATWLAWQESPDRGAYHALSEGGFDKNSTSFLSLASWLRQVFQ